MKRSHFFALGVIDTGKSDESIADKASCYFYAFLAIVILAFVLGICSGLLERV